MTALVYFLRPVGQAGPVKIGCSVEPGGRLATFMSWSPVKLEIAATVPGDSKIERRIHGVFGEQHSHSEWFYPSQRLTDFIESLANGVPLGELIDLSAPIVLFRKFKRRPITEDRRRYLSYSSRVRCAMRRLRTDDAYASEPEDANRILGRWGGRYNQPSITPTADELRRLDEVIANPAAHAVMHQLRHRVSKSALRPDIWPAEERVA